MHKTLSSLLSPSSTIVLKCDPAAIHFHPYQDQPQITCPETLRSLNFASHHLIDLLEPVAFPTETVYGLGATALNTVAASRIFAAKGRPADNPLIVHISSLDMLKTLLPVNYTLPETYQALIKSFWPGPLTLLFPRNVDVVPTIITAGQPTVAIRMPAHPVARALIAIANVPLAAPSANSSGKPSPTRAEHVLHDLHGKIDIILDGGACDVGLESTVIDGLHPDGNIRVLRPGGVTVEEIERVLKQDLQGSQNIPKVLVHRRDFQDAVMEAAPTTPGMKYRHYSPSVPLTLLLSLSQPPKHEPQVSVVSFLTSLQQTGSSKIGVLAPADSILWSLLPPLGGLEWCAYPLGLADEPAVTARRLFDGLLSLERQGVDRMLIEEIKEEREGLAVMNRVRKAAGDIRWVTYESGHLAPAKL